MIGVLWNCPECENTYATDLEVFEDIGGEFVLVDCPSCSHTARVELEAAA